MRNILSVVWAAGKLGAAYFNIETAEMFLLPDIAECAPNFEVLKMIFQQAHPSHLIASTRQDERFINAVKALCGEEDEDETDSSAASSQQSSSSQNVRERRPHPRNRNGRERVVGDDGAINIDVVDEEKCELLLLPGKDFAPDPCKARLQNQRLPEEPATFNAAEHLIYIKSLIPFTNDIMVRAAGALLRFLDRNGIEQFNIELTDGLASVLNICICQMDDLVMVDSSAWESLQIFRSDNHPATAKQGTRYSHHKEGLSVFNLLNKCVTAHGSKFLRLTLSRPTRNMRILKRRHDVVQFCRSHSHADFVKNAKDCLKLVKSFPKLLYKVSVLHASDTEWKELYQSVYNCMLLTEIVSAQPDTVEVFSDICNPEKREVLKNVSQEIMKVVDFDESLEKGRFIPKIGINPALDKKRQRYSQLPEIMSMVAKEEIKNLPEAVQQCSTIYIPEVGFLLAVNYWRDDLTLEELQLEGVQLHFVSHKIAYYKSDRAGELDQLLGDCQVEIMDMETTIMVTLSQIILQHKKILLEIGLLASELDSLMGMASAALEYNFIRPEIIQGGGDLEIKDGRHPLVEVILDSNFVPNSTIFEGAERVVILTGPNASGKSVYLKQVGIIAILALSGSFVPASFARIPAFDRICTRIHNKESVLSGMSTFMVDISQMSNALRTATKSSLLIADEFGKGTAEADGLGLLVATIEDFIDWGDKCPTIFVSTHFYSIMEYMKISPSIKFQAMEFMQDTETNTHDVVYLFKLKNGMCKSSLSHLVAAKAGVSDEIINRSLEIHHIVSNQLGDEHIKPLQSALDGVSAAKKETYLRLGKEFMALDLTNNFDFEGYLEYLKKEFAPFKRNEAPEFTRGPSTSVHQNADVRSNGEGTPESENHMDAEVTNTPVSVSNCSTSQGFPNVAFNQPRAPSASSNSSRIASSLNRSDHRDDHDMTRADDTVTVDMVHDPGRSTSSFGVSQTPTDDDRNRISPRFNVNEIEFDNGGGGGAEWIGPDFNEDSEALNHVGIGLLGDSFDHTDYESDSSTNIFVPNKHMRRHASDVFAQSGSESVGHSLNVLFNEDNIFEDPNDIGPSISEADDEDREVSSYFQ